MPKICRCAQMCVSPRAHLTQVPQATSEWDTTRWPGAQTSTSGATLSTTPQNSWPMMRGGTRRGLRLRNASSSLPQMPQAATRSRTSPRAGSGAGRSVTSRRSYSG
jgi:hypothetical protein